MTPTDPVLLAVARLERKVDKLTVKVLDQEKRLRWVVTVAVLIVGAVGGPEAAQVLGSGTA